MSKQIKTTPDVAKGEAFKVRQWRANSADYFVATAFTDAYDDAGAWVVGYSIPASQVPWECEDPYSHYAEWNAQDKCWDDGTY